jgi:uncharacterized membrane protein
MDWSLVVVQWLHVLAAITWVGASMTTNFIVVPALGKLTIPEQKRFGAAYGTAANRLLRPTATLVIVLGILRGTVFGQLKSVDAVLGTTYGITWLAALILAVLTFAWAEAAIAPTMRAINGLDDAVGPDGAATPEAVALLARAKRNALLELIGFAAILTCMILMRFGY